MMASASNGWPPPPPNPPWIAQMPHQTPQEPCYINATTRPSRRRIVRTPFEVRRPAYAVTRTTAPSATFTTKHQQSHHDEVKLTSPTDKHTQDHTNRLPRTQTGTPKPFDNTSCQTHPEVQVILCNDPNNDNPNLNQTDSLHSTPMLYSPVMQQQINKDSPILSLTQADHRSNRQPDLEKIEEEILQSLEQMTGLPTIQSIQAPIDFDKMIAALEKRIHEMTANTAPYPRVPPTTDTHNKQQTPPTPSTTPTDDHQPHHHTAHDRATPNITDRNPNPPHTHHTQLNNASCSKHTSPIRSPNNNHASIKTVQTTTTSYERHGHMRIQTNHAIPQAPKVGYVFHHPLPLSNNRDISLIRADIRTALQPINAEITTFLTTAKTQATAIRSQLQHLLSLSTTIHAILVPPTRHPAAASQQYTVRMREHRPTKSMTPKYAPNKTMPTAADSGMQNPLTPRDQQQHSPIFSTQQNNNMPKQPCVDLSPTNIELPPTPPHKNQLTTQQDPNIGTTSNNTTPQHAPHTTKTTTTMTAAAVERTQHLKPTHDWQEFPRPPEIIPTWSNKPSPHATHPTTTMPTTMTTTTAAVERTQHSRIPYEWKELLRPPEMIYSTKPYYLPHTNMHYTAKLRPNSGGCGNCINL